MALTKSAKEEIRKSIAAKFNESNSAIVAQYAGLTVAELTELRQELRKSNTRFTVMKNRLAIKSIETDGVEKIKEISSLLKGPVAVAFVKGDPAQAAKSLLNFQKEHPALEIKGGLVDEKAVSVKELAAIADLPSKSELLAKIVGSLVSPHRGLLNVLNGVPRNLVQVINAIKDTKKS